MVDPAGRGLGAVRVGGGGTASAPASSVTRASSSRGVAPACRRRARTCGGRRRGTPAARRPQRISPSEPARGAGRDARGDRRRFRAHRDPATTPCPSSSSSPWCGGSSPRRSGRSICRTRG